ncbi:unnamed protein product, partial [Sphacelaria rigidula]
NTPSRYVHRLKVTVERTHHFFIFHPQKHSHYTCSHTSLRISHFPPIFTPHAQQQPYAFQTVIACKSHGDQSAAFLCEKEHAVSLIQHAAIYRKRPHPDASPNTCTLVT